MKNQVYSWRLDAELKTALEEAAHAGNTTLSGLLESIVTEWLQDQAADESDADAQDRLREAALQCFGAIKGGDPERSETVRGTLRARLKRRHAG